MRKKRQEEEIHSEYEKVAANRIVLVWYEDAFLPRATVNQTGIKLRLQVLHENRCEMATRWISFEWSVFETWRRLQIEEWIIESQDMCI